MSTIAKLLVALGLDASDYHKGLTDSARATDGFSKSLLSVGTVAAGVGLAAGTAMVGVGVAGVKAFAGFQKGMAEVFTLMPGASAESFGAMTQDVKDFSMEFGVLPDKVIPGLYNALSSGVPPDNVFSFLEIAQKAATAGVTDLSVTVDGLTSVINAYGAESITAAQASDQMFAAVVFGKTTFEELSSTLYNVNPIAASLGVSFGDVTSAIAAMTAQGVPTAQTTTMLRQLMVELGDNTTQVGQQFKTLAGVGFKDFITSGGDVQGALQLLEQHALASGIGINELFGSVEAGGAALSLTGKGTELFNNALLATVNSVDATDRAFGTMNQTLDMSGAKIQAAGSVFLITIGEKLAPAVALFSNALVGLLQSQAATAFIENLGNGLAGMITVFGTLALYFQAVLQDGDTLNDWLSNLPTFMQPAVMAIGSFAVIVQTLGRYFAAVIADGDLLNDWLTNLPASIQPVVQAIASLITGGGFGQFQTAIDSTIARFQMMQAVVTAVFGAIVAAVTANSDAIASKLNTAFSSVVGSVNSIFTSINSVIKSLLSEVLVFVQANGGDIAATFIQWTSQVITIVSTALAILAGFIESAYININNFTWKHGNEIQTILTGVWTIIKNVISAALTFIEGMLTATMQVAMGNWGGAWETIKNMCAAIVLNIVGIITGALNIIAAFFGTSLAGIVSLWQNNWNMLATITTKIVANVVAILVGWVNKAKELGGSFVQGIISGVTGAASSLYNALSSLASNALNAAKNAILSHSPSKRFADEVGIPIVQGIVQGVTQTAGQLTTTMQELTENAVTGAQTVVNGIGAVLGQTRLPKLSADLGKSIIDNMAKAIQGQGLLALPTVNLSTQAIVDNMGKTLTDSDLRSKAKGLGSNALKGLISGMESQVSAAVAAAKSAAQKVVDGMAAQLEIKSPSEVFAREIGVPIVMGLMQGLITTWPLVTKWLKGNMAKTVGEFLTSSATLVRGAYNIFKSLKELQTAPPFQPLIDATDALKTAQDSALGVSNKLLDLNAEIAALTSTPLSEIGDHVAYNQRLTALYAKQAVLLNEQANAQANLARLGQTQAQAQAASVQQQLMINQIADKARQQYEAAQAQALTMMQTDAKGALAFFNERKAQIEEMAQLEKDRALATTDEERRSLDTQIRLLQAAQNAETTASSVNAMIQINPSGQSDQKIIDIIARALRDAGIIVDIRTRTA